MLVVVAAWLVALFMTGMWLGRWLGQRSERGAVAGAGASVTVALPALRCANGPEPRAWTRVEAESAYHAAKMYQESAEAAGLWNDLGRRALWTATVRYLEVLTCWSEGERR